MNKRFCGIDWGEKRVGISISDPLNTYSIPNSIIENNNLFFDELYKFFKENGITDCVIGMPLMADGKDTFISLKIREFSKELIDYFEKNNYVLQVHFIDERFSTNRVYENSIYKGMKGIKKLKNHKDALAASNILQDYLTINNCNQE